MSDSDCIEKMNESMRTGERYLVLQEDAGELAFGKGDGGPSLDFVYRDSQSMATCCAHPGFLAHANAIE
jgi:hypothetical protein